MLLTCGRCGDLNRPSAEHCDGCGSRLVVKQPKVKRLKVSKKKPRRRVARVPKKIRDRGYDSVSREPREVESLLRDYYNGK